MMLLWVLRFFVFNLHESPKYLMGRGRDEAAVDIIHTVAAYNGKTSKLTVEHLKSAEKFGRSPSEKEVKMDVSAVAAVKRKLAIFDASHVKPLFATRKLAYSTSLLITLWGRPFVLRLVVAGLAELGLSIQRLSVLLSHCKFWSVRNMLHAQSYTRYNGFVTY